ncbi:polyA polymerase [Toxoplasma gondii GT1]|uniref:PolyA polymerase n=2 Tax=Toxoplasma gondii TaxID=5811 RepID=S7UX73_TOXGG|nr:polyA polymerase [Toxoplasma gondii GT1]RQX74529.1 polyA polymerase [Toxoplasma gondii CAST]
MLVALNFAQQPCVIDLRPAAGEFVDLINQWPERAQLDGQIQLRVKHLRRSQLPAYVLKQKPAASPIAPLASSSSSSSLSSSSSSSSLSSSSSSSSSLSSSEALSVGATAAEGQERRERAKEILGGDVGDSQLKRRRIQEGETTT